MVKRAIIAVTLSAHSHSVYSADNQPLLSVYSNEYDEEEIIAPVEIGPAGNVRAESDYRTEAEDAYPVHFHVMWESRYVTEGRDNLTGSDMLSLSTDVPIGAFTFAPWLASGNGSDYNELNLNVTYSNAASDTVTFYTTYSYLYAKESGESSSDNEIALEVGYSGLDALALTASATYSFDSSGTYLELALLYEHQLIEPIIVTLGVVAGINYDYITDGHDGLDHARLQLSVKYVPVKRMEFGAYVRYSDAIDSEPASYSGDVALQDYTWGGVVLIYRFK